LYLLAEQLEIQMAEAAVVHMGENSPEHVAYRLLMDVQRIERKALHVGDLNPGWTTADQKWILDTYSECLQAAKGFR
jgi:hypothetical protein